MLRVGLTGELGSGKSTVAGMLADRGAVVLSSDDIARRMMQPGEAVYRAIIEQFGRSIVLPGGSLNRKALAALAFDPARPRVEELNAIVHPPVIAEQERRLAQIARKQPDAIVVIESALIFTTKYAGGEGLWPRRFDRILLVTAPDEVKIDRYLARIAGGHALAPAERTALEADARQRLAAQRIPDGAAAVCMLVENTGDLTALERRVDEIFQELRQVPQLD
jgi:dephospho-CoA kinase